MSDDEIDYWEQGRRLDDDDLATGAHYNGFDEKLPNVAKVLYAICDEQDEPRFAWLLSTFDGRFAYVEGGHDYTGWDCQSGLDWHDADSLNEALLLASQDARRIFEEMIERRETYRCAGGF